VSGIALEELADLKPGWDSYGALPVEADIVDRGRRLLALIKEVGLPEPHMIPTPDGGVSIGWYGKGDELTIDIAPGAPARVWWEGEPE
jgi:hypothetical protein